MTSGGGNSLIGRVKGPPCKVCGDEASGFHYGVDSCEGCKGFFRRCITQGMTHHCAANEACEITPFSRNSCQFCRLKKCFQVGMSREASRLGRRPKRLKDPQDQQQQLTSSGIKDMMSGGHRGAFNHQSNQFTPDLCMVELQAMVQTFNSGRVHNPTPPMSIPFSRYLPPSLSSASPSTKLEPNLHRTSSNFSLYSPVGLLKSEPLCPSLSPKCEPIGGSAFSLKFDPLALPPKFEPFSNLSPKFDPLSPVTPAQNLKFDQPFGFGSPDVDSANSRSSMSGDGRASVGGSSNASSLDRDVTRSFRHVDVTVGSGGTMVRREIPGQNFGLSSSVDSAAMSRLNDPTFLAGIETDGNYKPDIRDAIGFIDRAGIVHYNVPPGMIRIVTNRERHSTEGLTNDLPHFSANRRIGDGQIRRERSTLDLPLSGSMSRMNDLSRNGLALDVRRHCVIPLPRAEGFNEAHDVEIASKPVIELLPVNGKANTEDTKLRVEEPIDVGPKNLLAGCKRNHVESDDEKQSPSASSMDEMVEEVPFQVMTMPTVEEMKEGVKHLVEIGSMEVAENRKFLLADAINEIMAAHMTTCNYTVEKILKGLDKYEAICKEQPNGIPPSSDPGQWSLFFIKNMVPVIKRVVNFSKRLPAFKDLSQSDQIRLIQQNSFEVILVRYTKLFTSTGLFVPDMTEKIPRNKVKLMPNLGEFFVEQYKFADVFNLLELTDEELGLLTGIMIVRPENSVLENEKGVRKIRELYLQALYQKMKEIRPDSYKEHYEKTLSILPYTTYINSIHSQKLEKMKMNPHFKDKELDLHDEVFTT